MSEGALFKSEMCRAWEKDGKCRYGGGCQFAHGKTELREVKKHPRFKTVTCWAFATSGVCAYGEKCQFIHSEEMMKQRRLNCFTFITNA